MTINAFSIEAPDNHLSNPFFSKIKNYPTQTDQFDLVNKWYNPTKASPDLLSKKGGERSTLPGFVAGNTNAVQGENCAGIIIYKKSEQFSGNGKYGFREYISNYIEKPLIKGETYSVEFQFLVTEGSNYYCQDLSIFFSEQIPYQKDYVGPLNHITPQMECNIQPKERAIWYTFKDTFIATGKERFMTLGNFKRNRDSRIRQCSYKMSAHI